MKIAGADLSYTSPGIVVEELDENFNIIGLERHGFTTTVKKYAGLPGIVSCKFTDFDHIYYRYYEFNTNIMEWTKDCEYISVEDYAYSKSGEQGRIFNLAEFEGFIKQSWFAQGKKLRFYTPNQNKKIFAGRGVCDKIGMKNELLRQNEEKSYGDILLDISDLPPVIKGDDGAKPTSDIIDAFSLCESLRMELALRAGTLSLEDIPPAAKEVFTAKPKKVTKCKGGKTNTKIMPSLLEQPFLAL